MSTNTRLAWRERYEDQAEGYQELLTLDPFEDWESNSSPEITAEDELRCGLESWFAGDEGRGVAFFERALRIAERALTEKRLDEGLHKSGFPRNRGELIRVREYSLGILEGRIDRQALINASRDFAVVVQLYPEWNSQTEAYCLAAVRAALIGGDIFRARSLLENAPAFSWHNEEAQALKQLASDDADEHHNGLVAVRILLDRLRDPGYSPDFFIELTLLRLELPALCERAHEGGATLDIKAALDRFLSR